MNPDDPAISNKQEKKDSIYDSTNQTYAWSSVTQKFRSGKPSHDCDPNIFRMRN